MVIKLDVNNLPEYMTECITDDFDDCGMIIDKSTGELHQIEVLNGYKIKDMEKFKSLFIMISKDL